MLLAALTLLPLLPFLGKAISIDAPVFVAVAERIVEIPWDPFGFEMVWDSTSPHAAAFNRNPPLLSYYLAAWIAPFGTHDGLLHAALLPFPLIAALSFLGIARRVAGAGLAPAALLVCTPAFFVLSTTVMLDLPMLACFLFAVYALLRGREPDGIRWQWASGVAAAATGLMKYVGFAVAPLLAAGVLLLYSRDFRALLRVLGPALLAWGLWGAYTWSVYGTVHFLGSTDVVIDKHADEFWNQLLSTPVFYGGALLFPIALWLTTLARGRKGSELAVLGLLLGTAVVTFVLPDGEPSRRHPIDVEESVFAAVGFAGAFFLWGSCLRPQRIREDPLEAFLVLWLLGFLAFTTLFNWHVNAADALLAAPPVLLLLFRNDALRPGARQVIGCLAVMLPLSLLLATADAIQAGVYRRAAADIAEEIGERPGSRWFVGQWGLHHYLGRIGFQAVVPPMYGRSDIEEGDWLASARNVSQIDVSHEMSGYRREPGVWSREYRSWLPLRTTNPDAGAGFYSHHYGYVPFAWSREPFDEVGLGRVAQTRRR